MDPRARTTAGWRRHALACMAIGFLLLAAVLAPRVVVAKAGPPPPLVGVNLHPLQNTYATIPPDRVLELAAESGASVVRIDIHWGWIEFAGPARSTWYMPQVHALDDFLNQAASRHIQVLATIQDTPCWAAVASARSCGDPAGFHGNHPPLGPASYATFLRRLVSHVGAKIQYYEIWNEPNLERFWLRPNAAAYTRLLKAAYRAIKQENPKATVLAGATSGADLPFLRGMYAAGAKGYFDALSIHPYSGHHAADECTVPRHSFACGVESVHRLMRARGDSSPLWLTEFGIELGPAVDPGAQAQYVRTALSLVAGWPYVRGALWYELFDDPTGHDGQSYGLLDSSLTPRPAETAFQASSRSVTRART